MTQISKKINDPKSVEEQIIAHLRAWDWNKILDFCNNIVSHIKGNQNMGNRGSLVEKMLLRQDTQLEYVGQKENHKDFRYHRFGNTTLEIKSLLSQKMYDTKGRLKSRFRVKLTALRSERELLPAEIADFVLVVMKDGSFLVSRPVAFQSARPNGKNYDMILMSSSITKISDRRNTSLVNQITDINKIYDDLDNFILDKFDEDYNFRLKLKV